MKHRILLFKLIVILLIYAALYSCSPTHSQKVSLSLGLDTLTSHERDELFVALLDRDDETLNQHYHDTISHLFDLGLSEEVMFETLNRKKYAQFLQLLKSGYSPPEFYKDGDGTKNRLINHPNLIGDELHILIIATLLDSGHSADLKTFKNWEENDYGLFVLSTHPANKEVLEENRGYLIPLLYENRMIDIVEYRSVMEYLDELNDLLNAIMLNDTSVIEQNLIKVLQFNEEITSSKKLSLDSDESDPNYEFIKELYDLTILAIAFDCGFFIEKLYNYNSGLFNEYIISVMITTGEERVSEFVLANVFDQRPKEHKITNPYLLELVMEEGDTARLEMLEFCFDLDDLMFKKGETYGVILQLLSHDLKTVENLSPNSEKAIKAIIENDIDYIKEYSSQGRCFISPTDMGFTMLDIILASGNEKMITMAFDHLREVAFDDLDWIINKKRALYIVANSQVFDSETYREEFGLDRYVDYFVKTAFKYKDKRLLSGLVENGFTFSDYGETIVSDIRLFLPKNEDFLNYALKNGLRADHPFGFGTIRELDLSYRLLPLNHQSGPKEFSMDYYLEPFVFYVIAWSIKAEEIFDLWFENGASELLDKQGLTYLDKALKANRTGIVEKLIQEEVLPLDENGDPNLFLMSSFDYATNAMIEVFVKYDLFEQLSAEDISNYMLKNDPTVWVTQFMNKRYGVYDQLKYLLNLQAYMYMGMYNNAKETLDQIATLPLHKHLTQEFIESEGSFFEVALKKDSALSKYITENHSYIIENCIDEQLKYAHYALKSEMVWLLDYLFRKNPEIVNYYSNYHYSLLFSALFFEKPEYNRYEMVKYLLEKGADPNSGLPNSDLTLYEIFIDNQHLFDDFEKLDVMFREYGAPEGLKEKREKELMESFLRQNAPDGVKTILQGGYNPSGFIINSDGLEESYISYCSRRGFYISAFYLLLYGADIECTLIPEELSPLTLALINDSYEMARILLLFGADLSAVIPDNAEISEIEPGTTIEEWIDMEGKREKLFPGTADLFNDQNFKMAFASDNPEDIAEIISEKSAYDGFFPNDRVVSIFEKIFQEKSFEYIQTFVEKKQQLPHPGHLTALAASVDRKGLVDLLISTGLHKDRKEYIYHYYGQIIKSINSQNGKDKEITTETDFNILEYYPPLSSEKKRALAFNMKNFSLGERTVEEKYFAYCTALEYFNPEAFVILLKNDLDVCDEVVEVYIAVYENDYDQFIEAIRQMSLKNASQFPLSMLLTWAAKNNSTEIVQWLIESGWDDQWAYPFNRQWRVPMFWAIFNENIEIASMLYNTASFKRMNNSCRQQRNCFFYDLAVISKRTKVLEYLVEKGVITLDHHNRINLLNKAISSDNVKLSKLLFEQIQPDSVPGFYKKNEDVFDDVTVFDSVTAIYKGIRSNATKVIDSMFRDEYERFEEVYFSEQSLKRAIAHGANAIAVEILEGGVEPGEGFFDSYRMVGAYYANSNKHLNQTLMQVGWDKRRILEQTGFNKLHIYRILENEEAREWIREIIDPQNGFFNNESAQQRFLTSAIEIGCSETVEFILGLGVKWYYRRSYKQISFFESINEYELWKEMMQILIDVERQRM
ncbi:ankyrin repeat domain-containing protein [Chitinispirillales bacterium ANBcel5]|uniref:ankyrin repeat domain-containing protein n=1 Tax=Cellulosispirillum alkaliphilum TaxID=3039283 RepID=UPI002A52525C|nr:ankyrin repeat domain-containing protein [Chitinispirillales bacterium ANBcel5]